MRDGSWIEVLESADGTLASAAGTQVLGAGDAHTRTRRSVERSMPVVFPVQALMTTWFQAVGDHGGAFRAPRVKVPCYRSKVSPSPSTCLPAALDGSVDRRSAYRSAIKGEISLQPC